MSNRNVTGVRRRNEARCARLIQRASPLVSADLPWNRSAEFELDDETLATLVYMRDVEGFTDRDLVGLAGHPTTLRDPIIARFLDLWRSEEAEHSRVLDQFLTGYTAAHDLAVPARQLPPPAEVALQERMVLLASRPIGHVVTAAHMAWGAANELLTLNGYRLLARRTDHPVLTPLLARIAEQEARHYSFYLLQAEWRLGSSRLARRLLHSVLAKTWTPVGIGDGYKTAEEFDQVMAHLSTGPQGRRLIDRMDAAFSRLPGFEDLRIYADAVARSTERLGAATVPVAA